MSTDRQKAKDLAETAQQTLQDQIEGYDVDLESIQYTDGECTIKFSFREEGAETESQRLLREITGIEPDTQVYHSTLGTITIKHYKANAKKYPIIVETKQGKKYKMPTDAIQGLVTPKG